MTSTTEAQPLDVEALASGVHMSSGHLSREFRRVYGESPYSYLMTRRIERAKALLRRGDLSITEVCFAVGCSSLGSFSTRFAERRTILELIAKGSYWSALTLGTDDLDGLFKRLVDSGADVIQEPIDRPYGVSDCAFRDPTGTRLRINELR